MAAANACTQAAYVYPPTAYGTAMFSQSGELALADGDSGISDRLVYGTSNAANGCNAGTGWPGLGTLWVR